MLGGLLLATVPASAEERQVSLDWLKVVAFAAHQTDYSGVFVYQHGNRVETSRITHVVEGDGEFEKLEKLDGPKYEIIRHDGQIWLNTGQRMVQVDSRQMRSGFPALLPEQMSALKANYHAREAGQERVAGYDTQAILFQPKDSLRYAHKIWAHTGSGLPLKAAVLDDRDRAVEQYAFTQLQIGGEFDRSWIKQGAAELHGSEGYARGPASSGSFVNSGWVVDGMPVGFRKTLEIQRPMHGNVPVTQIVYSDGLSAISIFIEPAGASDDGAKGLSSRGAVNLCRKTVDEHLFTVVGEVPPRTVMQVIDSIRYNGN
ncbi:MAG: hypothetical protein A2Z95_10340 [Gallionellales bacterium GWA2_60_18]|nr:MAG: hypothetical protein A2Z95_10340 [Gallionellales bacterium GWA2_60_18]